MENIKRQDLPKVLNEMIEYYTTHKRGLEIKDNGDTACVYETCDGNKCAVGRKLSPEELAILKEKGLLNSVLTIVISEIDPDNKLSNYTIDVLQQMQYLHDEDRYWNENDTGGHCLTHAGQERVKLILRRYYQND